MHVCVSIKDMVRVPSFSSQQNVFEVLMASSRDLILPPKLSAPVVREALVCSSLTETQYYSSVLVHFPPVC